MPEPEWDEAEGKRQRLAALIAIVSYVSGTCLRYLYIFRWHPMPKFMYSDMLAYSNSIDSWLDPQWIPDIADTAYPPGTRYFFGVLKYLDPSLGMAMAAQLLMALAVPLLIGSLGFKLFGRRTGLYATAIASLYFPLFDYNGYLMSEGPFMFFMVLAFWCFVSGLKLLNVSGIRALLCAFAAGITIGVAASMKSIALPAAAMVLLALIVFAWKHRLKMQRFIAAGMAGLLLVLAPLSIRATRLNEGHFCLIANELSRSVLIGHCGNINHVQFDDAKRGYHFEFGCPSSIQKGFTEVVSVPYGVYENGALFAKAWEWTKAHPLQSLMMSIEHVFDLFFTSEAWPSSAVLELRDWVQFFHEVFIVVIFFPACAYLFGRWREIGRVDLSTAPEIFLVAPLLALIAAAFFAIGEARYRVPFDGFLILLAARWFTSHAPRPVELFASAEPSLISAPLPVPKPSAAAPVSALP